jgi:anti-sigma B factor antagonist
MSVSQFRSETGAEVLRLEGDFDMSNVADVERALDDALDARTVIVDLSGVTFLDSTILNTLQQAHRQLRRTGGDLLLVRARESVWHVFEVTMLDRLFTSFESLTAAERGAASAPGVEHAQP